MIKKISTIAVLLFVACLLLPISLSAASYKPLPAEYDGSLMPYNFSACDPAPQFADSLTPVAVSYVARHGARYLSSAKKLEKLEKALYKAAMAKKLTPEGERFFSLMKEVAQASAGKWGALSDVGIKEEITLGEDIARFFPKLTEKGKAKAISTFVPRVIMTMYEFLHALERKQQHLELYTASGHQNDSLLYCFDYDPLYREYRKNGNWMPVYQEFVKKHVSAEPARRLLAAGYDNNKHKLRELTLEMYGVLQGCRASGLPAPTDEWMTPEEYRGCWLASNLLHYYRNNITPLSSVCRTATAPLVKTIISEADSTLLSSQDDSREVIFHGYFGHAETLLPLFSTLHLPGCYTLASDPEELAKSWKLQEITPLGANLMIIFLKTDSGKIYTALRLNGRNIAPIPGKGEIVEWQNLRTYWLGLIGSARRERYIPK